MLTSSSESTYHRQYMVLQSIITLMLEASRYLGSSNFLENHTLWFRYKSIKMKQSFECCYSLAKCIEINLLSDKSQFQENTFKRSRATGMLCGIYARRNGLFVLFHAALYRPKRK